MPIRCTNSEAVGGHLDNVLFRALCVVMDMPRVTTPDLGVFNQRVTRRTAKQLSSTDPNLSTTVFDSTPMEVVGMQIPDKLPFLGLKPDGASTPLTHTDQRPVPTFTGTALETIPSMPEITATSSAQPGATASSSKVAIGTDGAVEVIKEVVPVDESTMEVDQAPGTGLLLNTGEADSTDLSAALKAINFKPGGTITPEMYNALMFTIKTQCAAASNSSRAHSKRIPTYPVMEAGPSRLYENAALSQSQQRSHGLQHYDGRVASAVARSQVPHRMTNALAPPPRVAQPPGFVPIPGPEFTTTTPNQLEASGKVGNDSVYLKDVVNTSVRASMEKSQDIITRIVEWHAGNQGAAVDQGDRISLVDTLTLPQLMGIAPQAQCLESYPRLVDEQDPLRMTHILWDKYVDVARVPDAALGAFMSGGNPESKTIVSQLRAKIDCSNGMANRLCTRLYDATNQYALEGLFFVLFFMADYKYTAEFAEIALQLQAAAEGAIVNIDLAAEGEALPAALATAEEAITNKRICLPRQHLSNIHINVLRLVSRGPAAFQGNENGQLIHSYFTTPTIYFALYDVVPPPNVALNMPTAQQIYATAFHLAGLLHAEVDLIRGWVRCQCVVNGKIRGDAHRRNIFYPATIELETMSMPKPVGRNFLWDFFCDRFEQIDVLAGSESEYTTLATTTLEHIRAPGAILATLVTIGVSTYFNYFNIGGNEINAWARDAHLPVSAFLAAAFNTRTGSIPPVFQCMVSNLSACTGFTLSPSCFRTRAWSAGFITRHIDGDDGWRLTWGRRVPYLVRVLCISWLYSAWHAVWGISGPYPSIHIGSELFSTLPDGERLVALHMGDDSYHRMAQSTTPFVYILYGLHFMNIYRQSGRINQLARIKYITITKAQSGALAYGNNFLDADEFQPLYDEGTFSIIEGTLPTYNWETGQILAPVLTRPTWPDMYYNAMVSTGKRDAALAGYPVRRDVRFATVRRDNIDISVALGMGGGERAVAAAQPTAPQNEGN